jgi:Rrf2 family protein
MQLSRSVNYAICILLRVHAQKSKTPVTAAAIAKGCKFPPRFLYRVLRRLVDAEVMHGISGPGGGYSLARAPSKITLLDIVEAVEGEQKLSPLVVVGPKQSKAMKAINVLSKKSLDSFQRQMRRVTLSQLARADTR